jgi:hypothetical protein
MRRHIGKAADFAAVNVNAVQVTHIIAVGNEEHFPVIIEPAVIGEIGVMTVSLEASELPDIETANPILKNFTFRGIDGVGFHHKASICSDTVKDKGQSFHLSTRKCKQYHSFFKL